MLQNISPKQLFLLDGTGALLTASLLFFVLARSEEAFGMPRHILQTLSAVAAVFALYSFSCCLFVRRKPEPFLRIIALANLLYCAATFFLLVRYSSQQTPLGYAYFIGEIIIIGVLAVYELRTAYAKRGVV